MVFGWGWGGRRRGPGFGPGGGYGPGYGRGWGGPPPGYGYGRGYGRGGGGGSCLRDILFLDAGCCLAEALGDNCLLALGPALLHPHAHRWPAAGRGLTGRMVAAVRLYQREVSARRPPVCRFTPSCSHYAVEALETHGAARGAWLTARRLLRCRPGAVGGADPVPAAA
jgi:putative membrane protein insertion efficiency factor